MEKENLKKWKDLLILILVISLLISIVLYFTKSHPTSMESDQIDSYIKGKQEVNKIDNSNKAIMDGVTTVKIKYIERIKILEKSRKDEKAYIDSINDNDLLRAIGKSSIKRHNMRK